MVYTQLLAIRGLRKEKVLKNKSKQVGAQLACNSLGKGSCRGTRAGEQHGSGQQQSAEIQRYH